LKSKEEQINFKKNKIHQKILGALKKFEEKSNELNKKLNFNEEYKKYINENEKEEEEEKKPNELPAEITQILEESKKYDKYLKDENYCSDFKDEDISDSDISDIDVKDVMNELAKSMKEEESKNENDNEDNEDINKIFIEKISKMKNSKEVKEFYYKEKLNIDIKTNEGKKERDKMFHLYLEGLQWILYYYYRGLKSWKWYYPYHYPPMISDFPEIKINHSIYGVFSKFDRDNSQPFAPYQSLLLILPKQSFNLLPNCYQQIPNEIPEYFPDKIEIDYNGKSA
jgi:5'-3' exonuclease